MSGRTDVVVVGAGPGGLAMSRELGRAGIDHVVLERGDVAQSWRSERWDSLRLLTPSWMTSLPGAPYVGDDPDGFMTTAETIAYLDAYRATVDPPLYTGVTVEGVTVTDHGFDVSTSEGRFRTRAVVAATGGSSEPRVPPVAAALPSTVVQLTALQYRRPEQVSTSGRTLVVGASASGVQIADELARAGHDVVLAVGEHVRVPRTYRGRDIYCWLEAIGQLDERWDEVDDVERARRHASIQVVGSTDRRDVDLNALRAHGVEVVGRLTAVSGSTALCSGGLGALVQNADLKAARLLRRIDEHIRDFGVSAGSAEPLAPTDVGEPPTELDLRTVSSVVWATGYRPRFGWLPRDAFNPRGRFAHDGGVGTLPGLYVLGLPFLRRRRSNLIAGIGRDAADLCDTLGKGLDDGAVSLKR